MGRGASFLTFSSLSDHCFLRTGGLMKLYQLLGLFTLVGLLAMPRFANARDVVVETGAVSIRIGNDDSIIINGKRYGANYKWNIKPNYFYSRSKINQYRSGQSCRQTRSSTQNTQRRSGNQIYSRSTVTTSVCK